MTTLYHTWTPPPGTIKFTIYEKDLKLIIINKYLISVLDG
jgi:hypothetical protein